MRSSLIVIVAALAITTSSMSIATAGENALEVDVTNLWINRLIGDEQYPDDCQYNETDLGWFTDRSLARWPEWLTTGKQRPVPQRVTFVTWKHWNKGDKLRTSGLIGPVTLSPARLVPVTKK